MSGNRSEPPFRSVPHERMSAGPCVWTQDADDGSWDTSCGWKHCFLYVIPSENNHSFCPYCGGPLQEGAASSPVSPPTDALPFPLLRCLEIVRTDLPHGQYSQWLLGEVEPVVAELAEALRGLVTESVHPYDGFEFEDGEWKALDRARAALDLIGAAP